MFNAPGTAQVPVSAASFAFQFADVLLRVELNPKLFDQGELRLEEVDVILLVAPR
jgi:hypothetical protein